MTLAAIAAINNTVPHFTLKTLEITVATIMRAGRDFDPRYPRLCAMRSARKRWKPLAY
jgi:hypothetical protein